jgi:DNA-binding NarL/FixJ family response regulator
MNPQANQFNGSGDNRPSLLIADDDPVMRFALGSQLEGEFHVVAMAANTTEAIELASTHRPDAALIDVQMPDGGAREAVPHIATCSPGTCIVILSGDESRGSVLELLDAGAVAYLRKGATRGEISRTLLAAVQRGPDPR